MSEKDSRPKPDLSSHPSRRNHRFFDSKGPGGAVAPRRVSAPSNSKDQGGQHLEIDKDHIVQYAHNSYVYCMLLAEGGQQNETFEEETLISGGGDGTIKLWSLGEDAGGAIKLSATLENGDESVLALALDGTFLYSARLEGDINVWDLETRQLIRRVKAHTEDVLTLTLGHGLIFTASANGYAKVVPNVFTTKRVFS